MAQNYHKKTNSATKRRGEQRSNSFQVFLSGFILGVIACQLLPYLLKSESPNSANDNLAAEQKIPVKPDFQFPMSYWKIWKIDGAKRSKYFHVPF